MAFVGGPLRLPAISERLVGARKAAPGLTLVETPGLTIRAGRAAGHDLLRRGPRVDAVVCASDPLAVGVIQAATEAGVAVPDDLLVIGYDDNHFASESAIPVSTVAQPGRRMGETATRLLLDEIRGSATHQHRTVVLEPRLIPRRSSQRPAQP